MINFSSVRQSESTQNSFAFVSKRNYFKNLNILAMTSRSIIHILRYNMQKLLKRELNDEL